MCGCRNKWRGATWVPRGRGRAQGGQARPRPLWPDGGPPYCVLSVRNSEIFYKKSYFIFMAFGELSFSGYFFAWIIQKIDRKYYFYFI